jgi:hypothetical protein
MAKAASTTRISFELGIIAVGEAGSRMTDLNTEYRSCNSFRKSTPGADKKVKLIDDKIHITHYLLQNSRYKLYP